MHDLAVILPSLDDGHWLAAGLPTVRAAAEGLSLDLVVVDIESGDDTQAQAARHGARVVETFNGGFAHANNVGLRTCDARYVLFLNADTEVVHGRFADLLERLERRPTVGLAGCRQLTTDGALYPTMRRFQHPGRTLAEALGSERLAPALGHRVLDLDRYERDVACDWTIGSFMLCRREALASAGWMDERFFFLSEEEDLCLRIATAGWEVRHLPYMTIVHHVGRRGVQPRFEAQRAFARRQYAAKHFGPVKRAASDTAEALYHAARTLPGTGSTERRRAERAALRVAVGRSGAPFRPPPATAVPAEDGSA